VRSVKTGNAIRSAMCDTLTGKAPNPAVYWYLIHTYIPWIHKYVEVTTGCGISHNIQIYSYTDYRILHLNTIN
jgi:hypothetical protein